MKALRDNFVTAVSAAMLLSAGVLLAMFGDCGTGDGEGPLAVQPEMFATNAQVPMCGECRGWLDAHGIESKGGCAGSVHAAAFYRTKNPSDGKVVR